MDFPKINQGNHDPIERNNVPKYGINWFFLFSFYSKKYEPKVRDECTKVLSFFLPSTLLRTSVLASQVPLVSLS